MTTSGKLGLLILIIAKLSCISRNAWAMKPGTYIAVRKKNAPDLLSPQITTIDKIIVGKKRTITYMKLLSKELIFAPVDYVMFSHLELQENFSGYEQFRKKNKFFTAETARKEYAQLDHEFNTAADPGEICITSERHAHIKRINVRKK